MTRFGRPIVGKIRTRFEMPRATGGCQVSHSAGRQIFDVAYRFYWYIEYFLRSRERARAYRRSIMRSSFRAPVSRLPRYRYPANNRELYKQRFISSSSLNGCIDYT